MKLDSHLPLLTSNHLSMLEDFATLTTRLNPQIPSLESDDFQWPSFEKFDEDMENGRVKVLVSFMEFDIEEATAHVKRVNRVACEPMLTGELRRRLADMNRLHQVISSSYAELSNMKIAAEEARLIHEMFEQHTISYWPAKVSYERSIGEARGISASHRIDFRQLCSSNVVPKFIVKPSSSGINASLPTSMERPKPECTVARPKPTCSTSLKFQAVNVSLPESVGFSSKPSHQQLVASPSEAPLPFLSESAAPKLDKFRSHSISPILSSKESAIKPASATPVLSPVEVLSSNRQGSAIASPSAARIRTPSSDHSAVASPTASRTQLVTTKLQRPANVSSEATQFHLQSSSSETSSRCLANAIPSLSRFQTSAGNHSPILSPKASRVEIISSQSNHLDQHRFYFRIPSLFMLTRLTRRIVLPGSCHIRQFADRFHSLNEDVKLKKVEIIGNFEMILPQERRCSSDVYKGIARYHETGQVGINLPVKDPIKRSKKNYENCIRQFYNQHWKHLENLNLDINVGVHIDQLIVINRVPEVNALLKSHGHFFVSP